MKLTDREKFEIGHLVFEGTTIGRIDDQGVSTYWELKLKRKITPEKAHRYFDP